MNQILIQLILGAVQGITEWLPVSSSAVLTLIGANFLQISNMSILLKHALFLHLGTFFAALIYFKKDVLKLTKSLFNYSNANEDAKKILKFLIISTIISGVIGVLILQILTSSEEQLKITGKTITFFVGIFLLITGTIQLKIKSSGKKEIKNIQTNDSVILGIAQGLSSLPGLSRSGITVSALLLKKFNETTALKLSFLMSLPIVLAGNIILNYKEFTFSNTALYGLLSSFIFGILTIHLLMKLSKKLNFGWFVLIFALLMIGSVFV